MTILQINKFYYEKGGAERYFFSLKKLLEEKGHTVIPFAMKAKKNLKSKFSKYFVSEIRTKPSWNVWQNFRTVFRFWWSWEAQKKLKKLISENKIDVVHIHNIYHQISPSILSVLKKEKIPVVMTVHDYALISSNYNLYQTKNMNTNFVQDLICFMERILHHKILNVYRRNIDLFIAPSEFVKNKLIQSGFDEKKIEVVPHFINLSVSRSARATSPSKGEDYILYFGRLSEKKGIQVLISAIKELPDIKLKIAGDGPERKNYELRIKNQGLKNVEILGYKNQKELQKLILNSEFVVVPSLVPETFGLSALEAMALGKVVLASDGGALPELIDKEFLFKSEDVNELVKKIQILTKDKKYVKIKGNENKLKVEQNYAEKTHYKRILGLYQRVKGFYPI